MDGLYAKWVRPVKCYVRECGTLRSDATNKVQPDRMDGGESVQREDAGRGADGVPLDGATLAEHVAGAEVRPARPRQPRRVAGVKSRDFNREARFWLAFVVVAGVTIAAVRAIG